ncbi:type 1 fimbrial protein [Dyella solisilvae]|uniref:Type 1 fimbrial protein n=2 Tax=Dyella solisilvae TaxID=1920168 RepID=A0A370K983_9GAMM|nr:type 1 fimbrial protein [Dyella solisilvae]
MALDLPGVVRDSLVITSAAIVPRACTTPNVVVRLGKHMQSEFMGEGYTTAAVRFQIDLNNCPAGMTSIAYRIDAATTVLDATQSVVALDGSSSATGVGVQLLDGSGTTSFPLGRAVNFEGYDPHAGGSYSIPLKARYYQTGSSVGVGPANTSMTFTMIYE